MHIVNKKNSFLIVLFAVSLTVSKIVFCAEFKEKVLMELPQSLGSTIFSTISSDNRWLVMELSTNEHSLIVIDLEKEQGNNMVFSSSLGEIYISDFYWEDTHDLILYEDPHQYYHLDIKDSGIIFNRLASYERDQKKFPFFVSTQDNNNYQADYGIEKSSKVNLVTISEGDNKGIVLLYNNKEIASYAPRLALFGLQSPSLVTAAKSPDGLHIFYSIRWYGGPWNSGPLHLYYLDAITHKVTTIDTRFMAYGWCLMRWSPDSKRFIYAREKEGRNGRSGGTELIEMVKIE